MGFFGYGYGSGYFHGEPVDFVPFYDPAFLEALPSDVVLKSFQVSGDTSPGVHFTPTNMGIDKCYQIVVDSSYPLVNIYSPLSWTNRDGSTATWLAQTRMRQGFYLGDVGDPGVTGTPNNPTIIRDISAGTTKGLNAACRTTIGGPIFGYRYSGKESTHGGSGTLGGEITGRDLRRAPCHAGAFVIDVNKYLSSAGKGYIWPAVKADSDYANSGTADYYGGDDPRIVMGSRLAVPRSVTAGDIGISSPVALWYLEMMQEYGVYIIDSSGWEGAYLCATPDAADALRNVRVEIEAIMNYAQLVLPKPLDQVDDALAGYGLKKLKGEYTGSLVRVRRDSDNSELDIGIADDGTMDTTALLDFCGVGNGYVVTWYDQSGNGRDVTQATQSAQPIIVSGGSLITKNSQPLVYFNGTSNYLTRSAFVFANGSATVVIAASAPANALRNLVAENSDSSGTPLYYMVRQHNAPGDTPSFTLRKDDNSLSPSTPAGSIVNTFSSSQNLRVISMTDDGANMTNWVDGVQNVTAAYTRGTTTLTRFNVGASTPSGAAGNFFQGGISELIIYSALSTTDRQTLEDNQMSYFGVA